VFNPLEVVPEFVADIGTKKGEKIDYAVMKDGKPIILIECKHWSKNLNLHEGQLVRYFQAANARLGILTNGIRYRIYTDLEKPNMMDEKAFFDIDVTDLKDFQVEELKKFHKSYFDIESIVSTASDLKYTNEIKQFIRDEFTNPSEAFVKFVTQIIFPGRVTEKVREQFTALLKKSFTEVIGDMINDRLKSAMREEQATQPAAATEGVVGNEEEGDEEPTPEEMEGFYTVRAILRDHADPQRITFRKMTNFFAVLLDDNIRKPLLRLYLDRDKKIFEVFDDFKSAERYDYTGVSDIYAHVQEMIESVEIYDGKRQPDLNNSRKKKAVIPPEDTPDLPPAL
jgi:hypothetical protein